MPRRSQRDRSESTRAALVSTARRLFGERGYPSVPAEEVVSQAGVTRGALYHHYADKRSLFRAVFEELESEISAAVGAVLAAAPDRRAGLAGAVETLLDLCQRPDVVRIVLTDAPAVLGWQEWREIERRHGLRLIVDILQDAAEAGTIPAAAVPTLAQLILSALTEAALIVAHATDPRAARVQAEQALLTLLAGLLPDPTGA